MASLIFPTGIPSKATPIGTDLVMIADSANSDNLASATISSIQSAIAWNVIISV